MKAFKALSVYILISVSINALSSDEINRNSDLPISLPDLLKSDLDLKLNEAIERSKFENKDLDPRLFSILRNNQILVSTTEKLPEQNCCNVPGCIIPCPGYVFPMYPVAQMPIIVPARTVFEPVVHDHPPLHKIKKIIEEDRKRKKWSTGETDYSESNSDNTELSSVEYY